MLTKRSFFTQNSSLDKKSKKAKHHDFITSITSLSYNVPQNDTIYNYLAIHQSPLPWSIDLVDICVPSTEEVGELPPEITLEEDRIFFRGMAFAILKNCDIPIYLDASDFIFCISLILIDTKQSLTAISHLQIANDHISQFCEQDWPEILAFFKEHYHFSDNTEFTILYGVKNSYSGNIKISDDMSLEEENAPGKLIAQILDIKNYQAFKELAFYAINAKTGDITVIENDIDSNDSDQENTETTSSADEENSQEFTLTNFNG